MSYIKHEKLIKELCIPVSIEGIKKIFFQMENCVCKIYQNNNKIGIGFICKIVFNKNILPVLITNNHVLNNIDNNQKIELIFNNEIKKIKIDKSRKKYISPNRNIDIAIIEIKPNKDKIYNYLEINEKKENFEFELEYNKKSIYIIHYPNEELSVSYGLINDLIDNKKIKFGSPILSLKTFKVIGIHYGNSHKFIKYAIEEFNKLYCSIYKNEINLIYKTNEDREENIFGDDFVKNNKNNIDLIVHGNKNDLIIRYKLKKGENNIKLLIKKKNYKFRKNVS